MFGTATTTPFCAASNGRRRLRQRRASVAARRDVDIGKPCRRFDAPRYRQVRRHQGLKRFLGDHLSFWSLGTKEGPAAGKIVEDLTDELLGGLKTSLAMISRFFLGSRRCASCSKVIKVPGASSTSCFWRSVRRAVVDKPTCFVGVGKFISIGIWEGFQSGFLVAQKGVLDVEQNPRHDAATKAWRRPTRASPRA